MFCYCPTSLSICPPFGIFGAFPYFIKVTHAVFSDRDKRKKGRKKGFSLQIGKWNEIDSVTEENVVMTKPITLSWL